MIKNKDLYSLKLFNKIKKMKNDVGKHKAKVYLDTSVPSAYYDKEKPERQELTKEFWLKIKTCKVYISGLVKQELKQVENDTLRKNY